MNILKSITNLITKNNKMETQTTFTQKGPKYIYDVDKLSTEVFNTITNSVKKLRSVDNFYYINIEEKHYDVLKDEYKTNRYQIGLYSGNSFLTTERFRLMISRLSKKGKKRVNKLLNKLSAQPLNFERLNKLWNTIAYLGGNSLQIKIGNHTEDRISSKRQAYKEVIKHIKLDLVEELKRTREEYRETKGNYFKK